MDVPEWTSWPWFTHRLYSQWAEMFPCRMSDSDGLLYFMFPIQPCWFMFTSSKPPDYEMWLQSVQPGLREGRSFLQDKTHATCLPSVFWSKPYFPPEIAVACWPGCQPECGPGLIAFPFLPAESASQLLSSVYLFLLSPRVGCVKCYYRLLPLRFVSLTVTFAGNLIKNSSQAVLGGQSVCPPGASDFVLQAEGNAAL